MSYILDALTKLDQERQRARAPDLYAQPAPAAQRDSRWFYLLGGAASAVLMTVLWFQFWNAPHMKQSKQSPAPPPSSRAKADVPPARTPDTPALSPRESGEKTSAIAQSSPATAAPAPAVAASEADAPLTAAKILSRPATPAKTEQPGAARAVKETSGAQSVSRETAPAKTRAAVSKTDPSAAPRIRASAAVPKAEPGNAPPRAAPGGVLSVAELPPSLQQEMPRISISGYAHSSDPKARVAVINNRMVGEGDEVAAGMKVEQIEREGVVFSYKGYRFRSP